MATENSAKSLGNLAINWKKVFAQCVAHWWWFAISVCVFVGVAFTYTKIKNQYFLTTSSILVADDASVKKSGVLSLAKSFDLGGRSWRNVVGIQRDERAGLLQRDAQHCKRSRP